MSKKREAVHLPRYGVEVAGAFRCFMTLNSAFIAA